MDAAFSYDQLNYGGERAQTPTHSTQVNETNQPNDTDSSSTTSTSTVTDAGQSESRQPRQNLQAEFQETFKAFSNSTWGAAIGGFWGNVRKQGESYYEGARKEAENLSADALKEFEGLRNKVVAARSRANTVNPTDAQGEGEASESAEARDKALEDNETFIAKFKTEAAKRLKEVQKAEDAADEALARFGTNIRNFLRDAVSVTAPEPASGSSTDVLFESRDALTGRRVIHSSRMDAQLHVLHTTSGTFTEDPEDTEWQAFKTDFDIEEKTEVIAKDLDKYSELRAAMERLVPEQVEYKDFWTRYYFLRHVVETQEEKRREMLKASTNTDEEVGWDEDSDSETESKKNKKNGNDDDDTDNNNSDTSKTMAHRASASTSTLQPTPVAEVTAKPDEPRRSHDAKSVADSEASYDLVSGTTSRAPGSPREAKDKGDDSDEDWE